MEEDNEDAPFLLVIAGPNGSGKTTITNALRAKDYDFGEYINPDEITQALLASNLSPSTQAVFDANRKAQDIQHKGWYHSMLGSSKLCSAISELLTIPTTSSSLITGA